MSTLLLDRSTWDLVLDSGGNLALATAFYAVTQDVSCAVRVFAGECWYNTGTGLPYRQNILGVAQSAPVSRAQAQAIVQAVPGVATARCIITALRADRRFSGVILITLTDASTQRSRL